MKIVAACLATASLSLLLAVTATQAAESCSAAQARCSIENADQLDRDLLLRVKPSTIPRVCRGMSGVELRKCKCEAGGTREFPCFFRPATIFNPESCSCQ
jgi:hypothetical protein